MGNNVIVFTAKMAKYLTECGFKLNDTADHRNKPGELVYWFEDHKDLKMYMRLYNDAQKE